MQINRLRKFLAVFTVGLASTQVWADVFIANPASTEPCEIIKSVKTTDEVLIGLIKELGTEVKIIRPPTNIKSSGQRVAMVELASNDGPVLLEIMDGTLAQCLSFVSSARGSIEKQQGSVNLQPSADWTRVGVALDGKRTDYVDLKSIRTDQVGLIRLWVKQEYTLPQLMPNGVHFVFSKISLALNCREYTTAMTAVGYYDKNAKAVQYSETDRSRWKFTEAESDSLQGVLLRSHCEVR